MQIIFFPYRQYLRSWFRDSIKYLCLCVCDLISVLLKAIKKYLTAVQGFRLHHILQLDNMISFGCENRNLFTKCLQSYKQSQQAHALSNFLNRGRDFLNSSNRKIKTMRKDYKSESPGDNHCDCIGNMLTRLNENRAVIYVR